jgi:hypothetical protein
MLPTNRAGSIFHLKLLERLLSLGSTHGAGIGASAAIDAQVSVDLVLAVALGDSGNGAALGASAASDARISDLVSHGYYLLIIRALLRCLKI